MARAKWSLRVWEPMTKEGYSLPFAKELLRGSLVWHCPALVTHCSDVACCEGTLCDPLTHRLRQSVTPGKLLHVGVSPQLTQFHFMCCIWGKTIWHPAMIHTVQGKGDKTGKYWVTDLSFCLYGLRAGQAARVLLLWFEVSGALDNSMIAVIHWCL